MGDTEVGVLRVLADAGDALLAREVAGRLLDMPPSEAARRGYSVVVAKRLLTLASAACGYVRRDYPRGTHSTAYVITERGREALQAHSYSGSG